MHVTGLVMHMASKLQEQQCKLTASPKLITVNGVAVAKSTQQNEANSSLCAVSIFFFSATTLFLFSFNVAPNISFPLINSIAFHRQFIAGHRMLIYFDIPSLWIITE